MAQKLSWSFSAGSSSGSAVNVSGETAVDAVVSASVTLDAAMAAARELTLQVDDVDRVLFLAISSSLIDGKVEVEPVGGTAMAVTGPLILYGAAVKLFAADLSTIKVQNKAVATAATLTILIGLKLVP